MKIGWTMTMSIPRVRRLILVALLFLVFSNLAYWVAELLKPLGGILWGICAVAVAVVCRAKAGKVVQASKQFYVWMAFPTLLALIPIIIKVREVFKGAENHSWASMAWELAPVFIRFIIPVALLWLAYSGLEGHLQSIEGSEVEAGTRQDSA